MRKWLIAIALLCAWALPAKAQVTLAPMPEFSMYDNNGNPCSGCLLYSFAAGTSTPLATYTDSTGIIPNTNPVVLDSAGRANVWLGTSAYKLVLKTAAGVTIYSTDNIISSVTSLLATNNVWTGTQDFQGAVTIDASATFNAGLTSVGPNVLNGGGTINGSWLGTPTAAGTWNFSSGFTAAASTFTGQVSSTVATGTAPFVISSTTQVNNLNAGLLNGCTWAAPCPLGSTTPNTAAITTLTIGTGLVINGPISGSNVVGNSGKVQSAGVNSGVAGAALCNDINSNATTTGCNNGFTQVQSVKKTSSTCTPATSSSFDNCTDTLTWPAPFADTGYVASCSGVQPAANGASGSVQAPMLVIKSYSTTTITVITQQERSITSNFTEIHCLGIHP